MKIKSIVIRVCSLVLLSVTFSGALIGCGFKSEKGTTSSSTTSTFKVVKSSAKTKLLKGNLLKGQDLASDSESSSVKEIKLQL